MLKALRLLAYLTEQVPLFQIMAPLLLKGGPSEKAGHNQ